MGKSPGKWIKMILFGKKASKSKSSKGRDMLKPATEETTLNSANVSASGVAVGSPLFLKQVYGITKDNPELEKGEAAKLPTDEVILSSQKEIGDGEQASKNIGSVKDSERIILEQATIKAQTAFRGYQACQAFRALRGIIRQQSVARGNLVRRQAVATLQSVRGIVMIQALVRGQRVRHSDIGRKVPNRRSLGELDAICLGSCKNNGSKQAEKLLRTAFVCKLLSSSPAAMPLKLHYGPEEPNSSWNWLNRWTMLQIGGSHLQPKKTTDSINGSCLTVGTEQVMPKGSVRELPSSHAENGSINTSLDSEKVNIKLKKITKDHAKSVHEWPQNGMKRVQRNLKKISKPVEETSLRSVVDSGRTRQNRSKSSNPDFSEEDTIYPVEKAMEDIEKAVSKPSDVEASPELPAEEGAVNELCNHSND